MPGAHPHTASSTSESRRKALWIALIANGIFLAVEFVGGLVFNSVALLADAGHMLSDVAGLAIALVAVRLTQRRASARYTYGLQRTEVLGALANALTLLFVSGFIVLESIRRLADPPEVAGVGLLIVAFIGLVVNLLSARVLHAASGHSLNMRGAFIHMIADAASSVGVVIAAIAIIVWGAFWVDPVVSIAIAALIVWSSWGLLRDTVHVLLEGAPRGIDLKEVEHFLNSDEAVASTHHLHLWNLASDVPALSAHIVLHGEPSLHDAQLEGARLRAGIAERFGLNHATLELECHSCEDTTVR